MPSSNNDHETSEQLEIAVTTTTIIQAPFFYEVQRTPDGNVNLIVTTRAGLQFIFPFDQASATAAGAKLTAPSVEVPT